LQVVPDLLFTKIALSYNCSDIFTTEELKKIVSPYAEVIIDDGKSLSAIGEKFSIKSIQNLKVSKHYMTLFSSSILPQNLMLC